MQKGDLFVLVTVGEQVSAGQLIAAAPEGALSANLHASIDGVVVSVGDKSVHRRHWIQDDLAR